MIVPTYLKVKLFTKIGITYLFPHSLSQILRL